MRWLHQKPFNKETTNMSTKTIITRETDLGHSRTIAALCLLAALALLGACSTIDSVLGIASSPTTATVTADANSSLDAAAKALTGFDKAATLYVQLPLCGGPGVAPPCSSASVSAKIKADAATARTAIENAQNGVGTAASAIAAVNTVSADFAGL